MPTETCRVSKIPCCGDGIVNPNEDCDDGANGNPMDGCRDDCNIPSCGD